jgi:pyruvate formate lyase activating enzyme
VHWAWSAGHGGPVVAAGINLKHETSVWFEITNLVIPGLNDTDQELDAMTRWIVERLDPDVCLTDSHSR